MDDPHPDSQPTAYLDACELAKRLTEGTITSVELVTRLLGRIDALDGPDSVVGLRAVAALADDTMAQAQVCDRARREGKDLGPLHGIPVLVKDNIEVAGCASGRAGSTSLNGRPARDATLVTRLRDAGAIVMGTTNLSEWANLRSPHSTSGWSATGGLVGNPWSLDRSAGGSSSGAGAALAAGYVPLAVGSETDGSIVCPASLNGVAGLKPTVGTVARDAMVPISTSQDSPGPMARSVADVALLFGVLSGQGAPEVIGEIRFGAVTNWRTGHRATDERFVALIEALRSEGTPVAEKTPPTPGPEEEGDELTVLLAEMADDLTGYLADRPGPGVKSVADVVAFEERHADEELAHFGHEFLLDALATGGRAGPDYGAARERNLAWAISTCLEPTLDGIDVLLAPSYGPAWKSDLVLGDRLDGASCSTMASAIAGWPIACVPMGLVGSLPVGVALIGKAHREWDLLAAAARIEDVARKHFPLTPVTWQNPTRG